MYLFIFEDSSLMQCDTLTLDDEQMVREGYLEILKVIKGEFYLYKPVVEGSNVLGWEKVDYPNNGEEET